MLKTMLLRTQVPDWSAVGFTSAAPSGMLRRALLWPVPEMTAAAEGYQAIKLRLAASFDGGESARSEDLLPAVPWLRQAGLSLQAMPALATRCEVSGADLLELVEQALLLQTLSTHAGQAKDGAMDTRVLLGGFGAHLLHTVLTGLRAKVANASEAEAEEILRPFAPMLVMMAQVMADRSAGKQEMKERTGELLAAVQVAKDEAAQAEGALKLRGEPKVERRTLVALAKSAEAAPPAPGRRNRRR